MNNMVVQDLTVINESNFLLYAAKNYIGSRADTQEFFDDLQRFSYIKRLFNKYKENSELKERLILNHIIVLYNVFGLSATRMLFYKLEGFEEYLKPFLIFLGYMPDVVYNIRVDGNNKISSDIRLDDGIVTKLREI